MQTITVKTTAKEELIDITEAVQQSAPAGFTGLCHVFVKHSTAAIIINENWDPHLPGDILTCLNKLIPQGIWEHDQVDNNGAAHIKATILGPGETIPIKNGTLSLGQWQGIGLMELDGPKTRELTISFTRTNQ